ncbi:MAG: M20/M25/M40 family metallo-hydrolase [Bryobacteraceae bacterium]|nr:M20/M25/M40 family metallo-hydrolase [Bryobacteraceae bacterium]
MNVFELTRALVDLESITGNELAIGRYLFERLSEMAAGTDGRVESLEVERDRFNVFACWGEPVVTLSTHMDTVPPFLPSSEDAEAIWGRGACDTKGIIASMMKAAEALLMQRVRGVGLLFVVGEERNSAGAYAAAKTPRGSRYLINGEPTENKMAVGSKGALRYEVFAKGRMAHSAYPELGDSAIDKLLDALARMRKVPLPADERLGASTFNVGTIHGGRAPNVIADEARAEVMIRLVDDGLQLHEAMSEAAGADVELREVLRIPAVHLGVLPGFETTVVAYTTDIPAFEGAWGEPFLLGPGTIHVAHTTEERVPKAQLLEAVTLYERMVKQLVSGAME